MVAQATKGKGGTISMTNPYEPPNEDQPRRPIWWLAAGVLAAGLLVWLGLASKQERPPYVGPKMHYNDPMPPPLPDISRRIGAEK